MTSLPVRTEGFFTVVLFIACVFIYVLYNERKVKDRVAYSRTVKWTHFNIVTLETSLVYFISVIVHNSWTPWFLYQEPGIGWWLNYSVYIALLLPIVIYLLILAYGKGECK